MKGILKAFGYFAFYTALTAVIQALLAVLVMAIGVSHGIDEEQRLAELADCNILGITILSGLFTVLAFYLIFRFRKKDIKAEWKAGKFDLKDSILPVVMSFSYSFLFLLITYNARFESSEITANSVKYYSSFSPMLGSLLMAANLLLVAPISEELAFRGIIYTRIEKTGNKIAAIIVSSLLFGLAHFFAGGGVLAAGAILMGVVLGVIFYKYGSLWICVLSHAAANLPDFILFDRHTMPNPLRWGLVVLFTMIFAVSVYAMYGEGGKTPVDKK